MHAQGKEAQPVAAKVAPEEVHKDTRWTDRVAKCLLASVDESIDAEVRVSASVSRRNIKPHLADLL